MKRLLLTLILIFVLALAFALCVNASYGVYDEIDALSYDERVQVENALLSASDKTGFSFYVGIIEGNAEYYSSFKSKYSLYDSNMVLLLIDNYYSYSSYSYVLHLFGDAVDEITTAEENKILDSNSVYNEIKYGNLANGICSFAEQTAKACGKSWGPIIAVSVASFLGGSGLFLLIVIPRYRKKKRGTSYPFNQFVKVDMTDSSDIFVTKTITRRRYRSSSSSSSSGGGGGGSSRSSSRR